MPERRITPRTTLENLRKEAKRRLQQLRAGDPKALARFESAYEPGAAPPNPGLRDVQHALALEYGLPGWTALKARLTNVAQYERLAEDMVAVYAEGDAAALARINEHEDSSMTAADLRANVWRLLYKVRQAKGDAGAFQLEEARELIARNAGFGAWTGLMEAVATGAPPAVPAYSVDATEERVSTQRNVAAEEWDAIAGVVRERRLTGLEANGRMTDAAMTRIAELGHVTRLGLGGSRALTDAGLAHLARMPQLEELDLSGVNLTDRGLEVLQHLPNLRSLKMCWQREVSDAGLANLRFCERIESVNLMGSRSGDGVIAALRGKPELRRLETGAFVTDEGLAMLGEIPRFRSWRGEEPRNDDDEPTRLLIDGPFSNSGLARLADLEGVYALDLFWHVSHVTTDGFEALTRMPRLGSLGCDGRLSDDTAMRHIGAIPRLRKLRAQGATATDAGFEALARSQTLERLWGRECPSFGDRGFLALSGMPRLRALGVSCKNVSDAALSSLSAFPALRELTAIGISDEGFRHVGRCERLERLSCMYCRDTTDAATGHIEGLRLKFYYAGLTQMTDRSLEILGRMESLEEIELYETKRVTDAGLVFLASLPNLREAALSGLPQVTYIGTGVFPERVRVRYDP